MSLAELLVALSLGGIVLGIAAGSMLRQQRGVRWVEGLSAAELQVRPVMHLLGDELSQLDASAGDIAPGQASDSSLQLRTVIAASLTCDSAAALTLIPETSSKPALGGSVSPPEAGDSVWLYSGPLGWRARLVAGVSRTTTACAVPTSAAGATYRLLLDAPPDAAAGTPVRVTRWARWVVYRAGDGRWYVGIRDYSPSTSRFVASQPVAGPFVRAVRSNGARTGFRYFDASGLALDPDGTNEGRIARVRITTLSIAPTTGTDSVRQDSADAVLSRASAP